MAAGNNQRRLCQRRGWRRQRLGIVAPGGVAESGRRRNRSNGGGGVAWRNYRNVWRRRGYQPALQHRSLGGKPLRWRLARQYGFECWRGGAQLSGIAAAYRGWYLAGVIMACRQSGAKRMASAANHISASAASQGMAIWRRNTGSLMAAGVSGMRRWPLAKSAWRRSSARHGKATQRISCQ